LILEKNWRKRIAALIDDELARQPDNKRAKPFSTTGFVPLTVFCWYPPWSTRDAALAEDFATKAAIVSEDTRRLLLELQFSESGELQDAYWKWISISELSAEKLARLRNEAEQLRRERVANAKAAHGKIGRNEPCPCGSGKKYKKCCIDRD
jgi:hypothetical protein